MQRMSGERGAEQKKKRSNCPGETAQAQIIEVSCNKPNMSATRSTCEMHEGTNEHIFGCHCFVQKTLDVVNIELHAMSTGSQNQLRLNCLSCTECPARTVLTQILDGTDHLIGIRWTQAAAVSSSLSKITTFPSITRPVPSIKMTRDKPSQFECFQRKRQLRLESSLGHLCEFERVSYVKMQHLKSLHITSSRNDMRTCLFLSAQF